MKKFTFILFLFFQIINAQNQLKFDFDYAQFRFDSTSNYFELYYSFDQSQLPPIEKEGNLFINAIMHVSFKDKESNEFVVDKNWALSHQIDVNDVDSLNKLLLGVVGFKLNEGFYDLIISIQDLNDPSLKTEFTEPINITPYFRSNFAISDLELATRIINENTDANSLFYKNTLEVFPNPSIVFSNNMPMLFYYCELYDLNKNITSESLTLNRNIFNSKNEIIFNRPKKIKTGSNSLVEIGSINLQKFPTDTYTLALTLYDPISKIGVSSSKKFFLINPDVKDSISERAGNYDYLSSEFGVLEMEECDDIFNKSKTIATSDEVKQYNQLDSLNSKREFLFNFWRKRDDVPSTPQNEFKKLYFDRVAVADSRYKTMSKQGFMTDRGRVYLQLGEPDQIDRYPNETGTKPYEIWYYNQIEGGVLFIFADLTGYNYYELLHSTKRGELQDFNWQRKISAN